MDIVLALRRGEPNQRPTIRHLAALSRFDETPSETVIELLEGGYAALGSGRSVAVLEARDKVLDALGDEPATLAELVDRTAVGRSTLQEALEELTDERVVQREGAGKRGNPHRYSLVSATGFLSAVPIERRQKAETSAVA